MNQFFAELSGWLLTIITLLLVLNFIIRFFGKDVDALLQLTTFVFLAVVYLGMAHGEENDDHIKVTFLLSKVSPRVANAMNVFNYVLATAMGALLTYAAGDSAYEAYVSTETVPGTTPLPTFPVKVIIFLGLLLFTLQAAVFLVKYVKKEKS